ncbi:MAG: carbonic anhydrase family protein [Alphaproteobacteria bacterium]|nr:carbonic anhydrase family protein [Alphaproteobacteria bacterium]MCD8526554.1 carbonic anhydrase family protein [Alphaproteobacteria bacterium]MCD8571332.1 carbonic anhydrase family protein [Alphaproteobacteria bacterium]
MFIRSILLASTVLALSVPAVALACDMCDKKMCKEKMCMSGGKGHGDMNHGGMDHGTWGYSGKKGPAFWGEMDAANNACTQGKAQSPINVAQFMKGDLPDIAFAYQDIPLKVKNTGHSVEVTVPPGSTATIGEHVYDLKQIHFHTPSEHYMDGAPYPMEAHLYHTDPEGHTDVIAVMIKVGGENTTIGQIWSRIPAEAGAEEVSEEGVVISAYDLLPASPGYYTYEGSLTTPPCTEGVTWTIMQQPIEITQEQLGAFQSIFAHNARPLQDLNGRVVKGD